MLRFISNAFVYFSLYDGDYNERADRLRRRLLYIIETPSLLDGWDDADEGIEGDGGFLARDSSRHYEAASRAEVLRDFDSFIWYAGRAYADGLHFMQQKDDYYYFNMPLPMRHAATVLRRWASHLSTLDDWLLIITAQCKNTTCFILIYQLYT